MNNELPEDNIIDEYIYEITEKGRKYCQENRISETYLTFSSYHDYYEFKEYCMSYADKDISEVAKDYIQIKTRKAVEDNDMDLYVETCNNKQTVSKNDENLIINVFKNVICELNRNYINGEEYTGVISELNLLELFAIHNQNELHDKFDLTELYDEA